MRLFVILADNFSVAYFLKDGNVTDLGEPKDITYDFVLNLYGSELDNETNVVVKL